MMKFKPSHLAICLELESKGLLGWQGHGRNYWLMWPWPWPSTLHFSTNKNHEPGPHFYLRLTWVMAPTQLPFRAPSCPTVKNPTWSEEILIFIDFPNSAEKCMLYHSDLFPSHAGPQFLSNAQNRVGQGANSPSSPLRTQGQGEGLHLISFPRDGTRKGTTYRSPRKNILWQCLPSDHRGVALQVK